MPSVKITLPADSWVDVTQGNEKGTISHYSGYSDILFVQATSIPTLSPPRENAVADVLDPDIQRVKYFSGLSSERVWACSVDQASIVVLTDAEI